MVQKVPTFSSWVPTHAWSWLWPSSAFFSSFAWEFTTIHAGNDRLANGWYSNKCKQILLTKRRKCIKTISIQANPGRSTEYRVLLQRIPGHGNAIFNFVQRSFSGRSTVICVWSIDYRGRIYCSTSTWGIHRIYMQTWLRILVLVNSSGPTSKCR